MFDTHCLIFTMKGALYLDKSNNVGTVTTTTKTITTTTRITIIATTITAVISMTVTTLPIS